jgi:hypothetical protein
MVGPVATVQTTNCCAFSKAANNAESHELQRQRFSRLCRATQHYSVLRIMPLMPSSALPAFFRDPPVTTRHQHPHYSATARAQRCGNDDDLYPCPTAGGAGRAKPLG